MKLIDGTTVKDMTKNYRQTENMCAPDFRKRTSSCVN